MWFLPIGYQSNRSCPTVWRSFPAGQQPIICLDIPAVEWIELDKPIPVATSNWNGVVVDLNADLPDEWERFIAASALAGVPVYHVKQIYESLTGRVDIGHLSENTLGSLNPNQAYFEIKQTIDWLGALFLLFLSPLFLLVAMAIKVDSPGPVLFRQKRRGYRGREITVYKFRTMTNRASERSENGDGYAETEGRPADVEYAMTRAEDDRITRFGKLLRRSRIDELPQTINILRGEMSWIGPRPEAIVLSEWYNRELAFYSYRHIVRPGITGWAQVNQGHVVGVDEVQEKLQYDFYYIKNFSFWLDLLIVMRTFITVFTGFGAR